MPTLAPPSDRLPLVPRLRSADDLDRALAELSWIDAESQRVEAAAQKEIAAVKARYQEQLVVAIDDAERTFAERRAELAEAVEKFAVRKRDALLEAGKKSRVLTHGTIGWRNGAPAVVYRDGESEKTLIERATRGCNLLAKLRELLAKLCPIRRVPADHVFDVKLSLNKTRVKTLHAEGKLSDAQLAELGLAVETPAEQFYLQVNDYPVQRESAA